MGDRESNVKFCVEDTWRNSLFFFNIFHFEMRTKKEDRAGSEIFSVTGLALSDVMSSGFSEYHSRGFFSSSGRDSLHPDVQ